jgi:hypothetical protein
VTLTTPATSGGIRIDLSTDNNDAAAPRTSSITIPEGSTTGTFNVDAHTVATSVDVQITARYGNIAALNSILRVAIFPPVARFTVTGTAKGADVCTIQNGNGDLDCRTDATASGGVPLYYNYTYSISGGSSVLDVKTDPMGDVETGGCNFLQSHSTNTDDSGDKYFNMDITLQIQDREGTLSSKSNRSVKVYTNGFCPSTIAICH